VASSWGSGGPTLRDVAGVANMGSAGGLLPVAVIMVAATLRGVAGSGDSWLGLVVPWRMTIKPCNALTWLSHIGASGEFGDRNCRACTMSAIPALMYSVDKAVGIGLFWAAT